MPGAFDWPLLVHDVGKIAIPPQILDKPGRLSEEEWAVMRTHVVEGQRMLDHVGGALRPVARGRRTSATTVTATRWMLVERLSGATAASQTCSAGVAVSRGGETPESLLGPADEALLVTKQRGRNQIALAA